MPLVSLLRTVDREQITVSTSVVRLDIGKRRGGTGPLIERVMITLGPNGPIRWLADGTDPTATVGHFAIPTGPEIILNNRNEIEEFRAIRQSTVDGIIEVAYQR